MKEWHTTKIKYVDSTKEKVYPSTAAAGSKTNNMTRDMEQTRGRRGPVGPVAPSPRAPPRKQLTVPTTKNSKPTDANNHESLFNCTHTYRFQPFSTARQ